MPFKFIRTSIPEVVVVNPRIFPDGRGFFSETYKSTDFEAFGIPHDVKQTNHAKSTKGVLRGLHYQAAPHAQAKLVQAIVGEIFDVAVDVRKGSPTYGQWVGEALSEENKKMLFIPEGFLHGYCVLSEEAHVIYSCNDVFAPEADGGVLWNDPEINIKWPVDNPVVSDKDKELPLLKDANLSFEYTQTTSEAV